MEPSSMRLLKVQKMSDIVNNMEQELAPGKGNDEEEEDDRTFREIPRRSIDSTSSNSKKSKKEWKGKTSVSNDSLLDIFNEVSSDMKVVTNSVGKIAHAMEHAVAIQEKAMREDPKKKLREQAMNEVQILEFTGVDVINVVLVFVKMSDQMRRLFTFPEPLRREYIVNMIHGIFSEF
jgi:hypothetical protein